MKARAGPVGLVVVNLWAHIVRRANHLESFEFGLGFRFIRYQVGAHHRHRHRHGAIEHFRNAKVPNFNLPRRGQEDVLALQIAVQNLHLVEVMEREHDLRRRSGA